MMFMFRTNRKIRPCNCDYIITVSILLNYAENNKAERRK